MRPLPIYMIAATLTATVPGAASADGPEQAVYFGLFGGGNVVLDQWDVAPFGDAGYSPESSPVFGGRIGGVLHPRIGLELSLGLIPTRSEINDVSKSYGLGGQDNTILTWSLDLLLFLTGGDWAPFIPIGGGAYHALSGDLSPDADFHVHYGLGVRGMLASWLALRLEARHVLTDGYDGSHIANNLEVTAGFDFYVWTGTSGPADQDEDGIIDNDDSCPTVPGVASARGCPDQDGDGIADDQDRCPKKAGSTTFGGCPDRDRDGLPDIDDRCPDKPGVEELQGCPDTDGDGITDALDRCPKVAGTAALKGCPDTDGDGIADIDDRCPRIPGVPELDGCLPKEVQELFVGTFEGIYFDTNRATIRRRSHTVLNEAAAILNKYTGINIRIEGHTDDRGSEAKNQELSEARAESVRDYLVGEGIAWDRIKVVGLGESRPLDLNKTNKGRQKNRRIEFHILKR